jgi:hypothetical protein
MYTHLSTFSIWHDVVPAALLLLLCRACSSHLLLKCTSAHSLQLQQRLLMHQLLMHASSSSRSRNYLLLHQLPPQTSSNRSSCSYLLLLPLLPQLYTAQHPKH